LLEIEPPERELLEAELLELELLEPELQELERRARGWRALELAERSEPSQEPPALPPVRHGEELVAPLELAGLLGLERLERLEQMEQQLLLGQLASKNRPRPPRRGDRLPRPAVRLQPAHEPRARRRGRSANQHRCGSQRPRPCCRSRQYRKDRQVLVLRSRTHPDTIWL